MSLRPPSTRTGTALLAFLVGAFLTLSGFTLGVITDRAISGSAAPRAATPERLRDEMAEFYRASDLLQKNFYYRPVDEQKLVYAAIKGYVGATGDEYTQFRTPDENKAYRDAANGNFVGLGVYTEVTPDGIRLTGIIAGGPAAEAGLQADDVIIAVDGSPVGGDLKADDIRKLLRGPEGSVVTLVVKRSGATDTREVPVTRRRVSIPAVTLTILPDNTAHLVVTAFNDNARTQLDEAFGRIRDLKVRGVVLDLRDNGGGYVNEARLLLGQFLPKDTVAMLEDRRPTGGKLTPILVEAGKEGPLDVPLVTLVNGGTASASEIIAGALQDYGRTELVGTKTFGKGSEQSLTSFANGASLQITIANWYTPKQRVVQKQGLQPDVIVEQQTVTRRVGMDPQLDKALEMLRAKMG